MRFAQLLRNKLPWQSDGLGRLHLPSRWRWHKKYGLMERNQPQYARQAAYLPFPLPHSLPPPACTWLIRAFTRSFIALDLSQLGSKVRNIYKEPQLHCATRVQAKEARWGGVRGNPQRKRAQSMQIFNQFQLEKSLLFVLWFCKPFLSVYVSLGAVKRIKTNVKHLREGK